MSMVSCKTPAMVANHDSKQWPQFSFKESFSVTAIRHIIKYLVLKSLKTLLYWFFIDPTHTLSPTCLFTRLVSSLVPAGFWTEVYKALVVICELG